MSARIAELRPVVRQSAAAVAVPAELPREPLLPTVVAYALDREVDADPERRALTAAPSLGRAELDAAASAARAYDRLLAPVTPGALLEWLRPVNLAVRNPMGREDFAMRAAAMWELLGPLPAAAFTAETRRQLRVEFFPSAEDVRRAVEPIAEAWRRKRDALRALVRRAEASTHAPSVGARPRITATEAGALLDRIERGPQDRWARMQVAVVARRLAAEAPDLVPDFASRLAGLDPGPDAPRDQEPRPRPRATHLRADQLAALRATVARERAKP